MNYVEYEEKDEEDKFREVIKEIKKVEIKIKKRSQNLYAGEYDSIFKGSGLDFLELREYRPGDEIRRIDWKASSKYKRLFVREYTEEKNMNVLFLVDLSPSSIHIKDGARRIEIAKIIATLSYEMIKRNDYIGLGIFTSRLEKYVPPKRGRKHLYRIIKTLLTYESREKKTSLARVLREIRRRLKRRTIIIIISDFIDHLKEYVKEIEILARKHEVIALHIYFDVEMKLDIDEGLIVVEDPESGEIIALDVKEVMEKYMEERRREVDVLEKELTKRGVKYVKVNLNRDIYKELIKGLKSR